MKRIIALISLFVIWHLVSAAPTLPPPNGNPSSPITTSATDQQKTGGFMIATDAGKQVGIGTASPGQKLTVAGTIESTSGGFKFPDATTQTTAASGAGTNYWTLSGTNLYPTSTTYVIGVGTATPDSNYEITTSGGGIKAESTSQPAGYFSSASGYGLIVNSGNVGIGTTGPTGTLHVVKASAGAVTADTNANALVVESSGAGGISILNPNASDGNIYFGNPAESSTLVLRREATTADFVISGQSSGERMRVKYNGNVGIGTTSPTKKLHVYGQPSEIRVTGSSGTTEDFDVGTSNLVGHYLWGYGLYDLIFATNNAERMRITSSGNAGVVAIGTTVTTGASGADLIMKNNAGIRGVNAAGTNTAKIASITAGDALALGPGSDNRFLIRYKGPTVVSTTVTDISDDLTVGHGDPVNAAPGFLAIVSGERTSFNGWSFSDLVFGKDGGGVTVVSSQVTNAADTRTYSISGRKLRLVMGGDTYNVYAVVFELTVR